MYSAGEHGNGGDGGRWRMAAYSGVRYRLAVLDTDQDKRVSFRPDADCNGFYFLALKGRKYMIDLTQGGDFFRSFAFTLRQANGEGQSILSRLADLTTGDDSKPLTDALAVLQGPGGSQGVDPKNPGLLEGVARMCDAWAVAADKAAADAGKRVE